MCWICAVSVACMRSTHSWKTFQSNAPSGAYVGIKKKRGGSWRLLKPACYGGHVDLLHVRIPRKAKQNPVQQWWDWVCCKSVLELLA